LIERRASEYARGRGFSFVTCGHTHFPLVAAHEGVLYINSGTWTETPPCPYVTVQGGEVRLHYWPATVADAGQDLEIPQTAPAQVLPTPLQVSGERA
jgi:hypothetical protein